MKKTLVLISIFLIISALGAGAYYFFTATTTGTNAVKSVGELLPFGNNTIPSGNTAVSNGGDTTVNNTSGGTAGAQNTGSSTTAITGIDTTSTVPSLRKITIGPVSGFTSFSRKATTTKPNTIVRYIERGTGNIFDASAESLVLTRVTNTTYPRIQEAFFANNGNSVIIRSLSDTDQIKTYAADIVPGTSIGALKGAYLDDNISFVDVSPDTTKIVLVYNNPNSSIIRTSDYKGNSVKTIYTSQINEWLPQWYNTNTITLTTKPSSGTPGALMSLNLKTNTTKVILGNLLGLTTLVNPAGTTVLAGEASGGNLKLSYLNTTTGTTSNSDKRTLPEKCVWSKKNIKIAYCLIPTSTAGANLPDSWYQGITSFSDSVWKLDTSKNTSTFLYSLIDSNSSQDANAGPLPTANMDGIKPALSSDENYLFFINKKDGSLWELNLSDLAE